MRKTVHESGLSRLSSLTETDEFDDLLRLAKKGDADAFAALWRTFQPGLLRYLRVIAGQAADDLAADTWLQVIRKLTTFEGNDRAFRAWICTIARNRHIDWRRQTARRKESLVEVDVLDRIPEPRRHRDADVDPVGPDPDRHSSRRPGRSGNAADRGRPLRLGRGRDHGPPAGHGPGPLSPGSSPSGPHLGGNRSR